LKFSATPLQGVFVIELDRLEDERGFFARSYCAEDFAAQGLCAEFPQCSISFNRKAGTLRGMHYQVEPHSECKLVRCTMGAVYDVALDLRPNSASYKSWFAVELSAHNRRMLYIPKNVAHGFQSLRDDSEVLYQISTPYQPTASVGLRWDDRAFNISWPRPVACISEKDRLILDFSL
jgi:dTDP-4-dehydrorhamnose 3,5-epimerase